MAWQPWKATHIIRTRYEGSFLVMLKSDGTAPTKWENTQYVTRDFEFIDDNWYCLGKLLDGTVERIIDHV